MKEREELERLLSAGNADPTKTIELIGMLVWKAILPALDEIKVEQLVAFNMLVTIQRDIQIICGLAGEVKDHLEPLVAIKFEEAVDRCDLEMKLAIEHFRKTGGNG